MKKEDIKVLINHEKCIGCGLCVADCPSHVLELQDVAGYSKEKAVVLSSDCLKCGHCLAVCPERAAWLEGYRDSVLEMSMDKAFLEEQQLEQHLKMRRSVRQYKDVPVEKEKIKKIINAGRITPTATNDQNVRYIVVQRKVDLLEDKVLAQYEQLSKFAPLLKPFVKYDLSKLKFKRGFLFHEAPAVILVISESEINAHLAAMSMELMAESLGLGTLYVGLFTRVANINMKLRRQLKLAKKEKIAACLALGYPSVRYLRSAPRASADVLWG